jgi:hypothetical protein
MDQIGECGALFVRNRDFIFSSMDSDEEIHIQDATNYNKN